MKLRQAVLAAPEIEPVRRELFELFGLEQAFVDPGVAAFGLTNAVMALGDTFLEVVVPVQENTTAGRLLERRGGACGYMLIFQVDDFEAASQRLDALGVRIVWSYTAEAVSACHLHPKDVGGAIVSFDEMRPPADWVWGGPDWRSHRAADATRVLGSTLQAPEPEALAKRWSQVLDRPLRPNEARADGHRIDLDDGSFLAFEAGGAEPGIRRFTFEVADPDLLRERAAKLGLGRDRPKIGDLELEFVPAT